MMNNQTSSHSLYQITFLCITVVSKRAQVDLHVSEMIRFILNSASANKTVETVLEINKKLKYL